MLLRREFPSYLGGKKRARELIYSESEREWVVLTVTSFRCDHPWGYSSHRNTSSSSKSHANFNSLEIKKEYWDVPSLPGDGVETPSENSGSYVASRGGHTGHGGPVVGPDVVHLHRIQVGDAIEAPDHVDVVIE